MTKRLVVLSAAVLALGLGAAAAQACIDVELAFDPAVANPWDPVHFFVSVANLGDEAVVADFELTLEFNGTVFGPFSGQLPLAAGEELSRELMLLAPPVDGTLTVTLTVTAGDCSDTASASLTITGGGAANPRDFQRLGEQMLEELSPGALSQEPASWGEIKGRYQ